MIFKRKDFHSYTARLKLFDAVASYESLLARFLTLEPHTLLNIGKTINFFQNATIDRNALSIGIDPVKEWSLIKAGLFQKITVYDIDEEMVSKGNDFWKAANVNIQYAVDDIIALQELPKNTYSALLLFQMDYVFSDEQIGTVLQKAKAAGVSECFVITPSLYQIHDIKNIVIFSHDWLKFMTYLFQDLKMALSSRKNVEKEYYWTYKRTVLHFQKLFEKNGYHVKMKQVYLNPNGSFHLYKFAVV